MLKPNFIYELKQLLRNRWLQVLSLILLVLFAFAVHNGLQKVEKRSEIIEAARNEVKERDVDMLLVLDSLEQGLEVSLSSYDLPSSPVVVGTDYPRLAAMPAEDFAFIATGQSDLFSHHKTPKMYSSGIIEDFTEMTSPVQLLFGSFDLAFVIIYLLPLLIIAFSYNVLSAERESGSLKLLASQPIGLRTWVLQKLLIRFFWLSLVVLALLTLVFAVYDASALSNTSGLFALYGLVLAYMLFWFVLAFLVNLLVGSSAKNAVALLGLWVGFVLILPSVINQLGTAIYPMPSRSLMINELRTMQADVAERRDEILDSFLSDHPEYAVNDTTQSKNFWHGYIASHNLLRDNVKPILKGYNAQLNNQQAWINRFKWFSPAVTVQESLNRIAGTSTSDYEDYRTQVLQFSDEWRMHFIPFLYNNKAFKKQDYANLPAFKFQGNVQTGSLATIVVLLLLSLVLVGAGYVLAKKTSHLIFT